MEFLIQQQKLSHGPPPLLALRLVGGILVTRLEMLGPAWGVMVRLGLSRRRVELSTSKSISQLPMNVHGLSNTSWNHCSGPLLGYCIYKEQLIFYLCFVMCVYRNHKF